MNDQELRYGCPSLKAREESREGRRGGRGGEGGPCGPLKDLGFHCREVGGLEGCGQRKDGTWNCPPPRISADPHILGVHLPACSMGPCVHGLDEARGLFSSFQVHCCSSKGPVMWARHSRLPSSMCLRVLKGPLTREPEAGLHQEPWLPAQGILPKLKHDFHPCLSSCHLAPFSWELTGLSACARCDWQQARAMSAI